MSRLAVMQTDQLACFDPEGRQKPCQGTGQDGDTRAGHPWPEVRFVPSGSLVFDRISGLIWPRDAGVIQWPLTWKEAKESVAGLNAEKWQGCSDWMLPTRGDLFSLISHARINPALPAGHPFENVFPGYYWTATPCRRYPRQSWYVHLGGGRIFRGMKHGSYLVWPVRQPLNSGRRKELLSTARPRFQCRETAVLDCLTELLWLSTVPFGSGTNTWPAALESVKQLNRQRALGSGDWRLPNIRELESLIDTKAHSPAIHPGNPLQALGQAYWSSTTSVYNPAYAWVVYMRNGEVGVGFKAAADFDVLAVRSADPE